MGWWKTAKPGDKVVCVVDGWPQDPDCYDPSPLRMGCVYTVHEILAGGCAEYGQGIDGIWREDVAVVLWEVRNTDIPDGGFDVRRFRPVEKRKTSIAIFEAMLHQSKSPKRVEA